MIFITFHSNTMPLTTRNRVTIWAPEADNPHVGNEFIGPTQIFRCCRKTSRAHSFIANFNIMIRPRKCKLYGTGKQRNGVDQRSAAARPHGAGSLLGNNTTEKTFPPFLDASIIGLSDTQRSIGYSDASPFRTQM